MAEGEKKKIKKKESKKKNFWSKMGDIVKDAVDCCLE